MTFIQGILAMLLTGSLAGSTSALAAEVSKTADGQRDALTAQKRNEAIDQLERIVSKVEPGPGRADLLYQLSELYLEKSRSLLQSEMGKYEEQYRSYEAASNRGEKRAPPTEDHRESNEYRLAAMKQSELILRDYPSYERRDEVLFSLGYNLYEIGKKPQAVARYQELIRDYPRSRFAADTYVQLGNHYFDVENNLLKARENYQKALASNIPKIQSYALYKLAWCDYNAGDFEAALKKLQDVVDSAELHGAEMVDLKNEALSDMVPVFVRLDRADQAIRYFESKAGPQRKWKLVARMAEQLADSGHHENAIKTLEYLISRSPNQPQAPEYQQAIVKSYEGLRRRDMVKAEMQRLVQTYRPGTAWWTANQPHPEVLRNAFNVSEEAMRTLVTEYHQEAQRTKEVETYRLARDIYRQYIDAFASASDEAFVSDQALNMRFYYAEILWALEEWENAAAQYEALVVFKVPDRESAREVSQDRYRKTAAYNAILAYDKLIKIDRGQLERPDLKNGQKVSEGKAKGTLEQKTRIEKRSAKDVSEEALSPHEAMLVNACDRYNKLFPGSTDEIELRYLAALVLYERKHFVDAAQRFGDVILKWPEERRSQEAADLTMYILETRGEWLELSNLSRQFLANKKLSKPGTDFATRVATVLEGSHYKWVDEIIYKRDRNPRQAGEEFLKFVEEFPRSANADRALTYSMLMFREARLQDRAISAGERVLKEYRGSPFELKVRYTLAGLYERTASFQKAAAMYEAFVAAFDQADAKSKESDKSISSGRGFRVSPGRLSTRPSPDERKQLLAEAENWVADAQFNAALWWEALGRYDRAITSYRAYMARFKDRHDVSQVQYGLGLIYEKSKRWNEAIKAYEEFDSLYAKDPRTTPAQHYLAAYRQLLAHRNLGDAKESDLLISQLLKGFPKLPREAKKDGSAQEAYAHVRFLAVEPLWSSYADIKFSHVPTLKRDLKEKEKKLTQLEKAYTEVLATGSGTQGIAALTRIGLGYADLAQNIVESPNPGGLSTDQLEIYRGELENLSLPLEEKAVEALEKAVLKGNELGVYNEWTLLAQEAINRYRPRSYAKAREAPITSDLLLASAPLQKADREAPNEQKSSPPSGAVGPRAAADLGGRP